MSTHLRKQIRDAAVDLLMDLTTTGVRVFPSRRYPLKADELPALCVYAASEDSQPETIGTSRRTRRILELVIEGVAKDNDTLDDTLDLIATEVETAIGAAANDGTSDLRGVAQDAVLVSTKIGLQPDPKSEFKIGSVVLTYRVSYRTLLANATST